MRKNTEVPCPTCGVGVGVMCRSLKERSWTVEHVHAKRLHAAIRNRAVKKAFQSLRDNQGQNQ